MTDTTTHIPTQAIEDMRDTLTEMGFVNAQHAPETAVLNRIASKFGSVQGYLDFFGPY